MISISFHLLFNCVDGNPLDYMYDACNRTLNTSGKSLRYMFSKIASIIKPRFFLIVVTLALLGVITLYFYAINLEPAELRISDISEDYVGQTIITRGIIKEVRTGESLSITLLDANEPGSILVYAPTSVYEELSFKSALVPSAELEVKGEVKEYNGELEIYIQTHTGISLLSESQVLNLKMQDLAMNPELYRNMNVSVEGLVIQVETFQDTAETEGTNLLLRSGSFNLKCIVFGKDSSKEAEIGSTIIFRGRFEYNSYDFGWYVVYRE